jgi:hypothetical protein
MKEFRGSTARGDGLAKELGSASSGLVKVVGRSMDNAIDKVFLWLGWSK